VSEGNTSGNQKDGSRDLSKDSEDGKAGSASAQRYNEPVWPGQKSPQAAGATPPQGAAHGGQSDNSSGDDPNLPDGIRPLQLPSKPKNVRGPNLQIGAPTQEEAQRFPMRANSAEGVANSQQGGNQGTLAGNQGALPGNQPVNMANQAQEWGFNQSQANFLNQPGQPPIPQRKPAQNYKPKQPQPTQPVQQSADLNQSQSAQPAQPAPQWPGQQQTFIQQPGLKSAPPLPGVINIGRDVGLDVGLPQLDKQGTASGASNQALPSVAPLSESLLNRPTEVVLPTVPTSPVITSASAKPDWNQPQWPGAKNMAEGQVLPSPQAKPLYGGNQLPPAISPVPQVPFGSAPPASARPSRSIFSTQQAGMSLGNITIKRDLALAKQLFGEAARPKKERHEYKQTEYIPKAPTIRVAAPDPSAPWRPAPAAQFEFYSEEEEQRRNNWLRQQQLMQQQAANLEENQEAVGFTNATQFEQPVYDENAVPDPRYAPFQGELLKDIARQDRRFGRDEEPPIPQERRDRGAAALRALGRNADKFYDQNGVLQNGPNAGSHSNYENDDYTPAIKLTTSDIFGLATYYFIVTKEVLTKPGVFFSSMSLVGGLNDPLLYLAFTSIMTGVLLGIAKLNIFVMLVSVFTSFISATVGAVISQFVFKKLNGAGKFEQTFNVIAYSRATFIFSWLSIGTFPAGAVIAAAFGAYLNYLGLSRVHRLSPAVTWSIIITMAGLPLFIGLVHGK
jgi:hypothetical protein